MNNKNHRIKNITIEKKDPVGKCNKGFDYEITRYKNITYPDLGADRKSGKTEEYKRHTMK